MKIAIIGTAYPYRGGLSAYNERLAKQLMSEGHEVKIYTFTVQYPNFLFPGKSQYSTDEAPKNLKIVRSISSVNPLNWLKIGNEIKNEKPDLVLVKYWLPFMGPCFGTILRRIKSNKHSKVITIIDNIIPHEKRIGDRVFTNYYVKPVDAFVAMTQSVLDDVDQFDKKKPRVLSPHPVYDNFGDIAPREEALQTLGLDSSYKYMLFFGLIRDYKGLDLLLESFSDSSFRNSGIKLIVAGEYYSDKEKYTSIIESNNLQDEVIQVDKFIPDSEVAHFFNACDLVVQPYKTATQSGVTQIAYHFNKPMIVTDVGGLKEMCPDEKVGYVVDPKADLITAAIHRFYNDTDVAKMQANIIEEKKKYSWEELTSKLIKLVKEI